MFHYLKVVRVISFAKIIKLDLWSFVSRDRYIHLPTSSYCRATRDSNHTL